MNRVQDQNLARHFHRHATMVLMLVVILSLLPRAASGQTPSSIDFDDVRTIVAQHDGRWPPLDTVARDLVWKITGDQEFEGHDPVALLLGWTFDPPRWMKVPLIKIANAELRAEFGLDGDKIRFSFLDLINHDTLRPLMQRAATIDGRKPDPLEEKALDIRKKLLSLQRIWGGEAIRIIPNQTDELGSWRAVPKGARDKDGLIRGVQLAWASLSTAYLKDDAKAFNHAAEHLTVALKKLPSAHQIDRKIIPVEITYNKKRPFRLAAWALVIGCFIAAISLVAKRKWLDIVALVSVFAGFGLTTWGLSLRWDIAGRIPAANMYESLLFLAWGTSLFAVIATLVQKQRLVPFTASFMAALTMFLCNVLPVDPFVRPIAPVLLGTVWMSIHVPIIMVSYSVLTLAVFVAHIQLFTMTFRPRKMDTIRKLDVMHYWYVHLGTILLTLGIITGSMWAASSWGRYWGWDPKEVWSLVALLGYMVIIHMRGDRGHATPRLLEVGALLTVAIFTLVITSWGHFDVPLALGLSGAGIALLVFLLVRGVFATAIKSIVCFWLVVMTYVGVNFVLGTGMHSYGFGKGAVVRYVTRVAIVDLSFICLCTGIVMWRTMKSNNKASKGPSLLAPSVTRPDLQQP